MNGFGNIRKCYNTLKKKIKTCLFGWELSLDDDGEALKVMDNSSGEWGWWWYHHHCCASMGVGVSMLVMEVGGSRDLQGGGDEHCYCDEW